MTNPYTPDELALMRQLIEDGVPLCRAYHLFPRHSRSSLSTAAIARGMRWSRHYRGQHPPELVETIRRLWDETDISATMIGEQFGMTKNAIIGMASRGNWRQRQRGGDNRPSTLADRMGVLHAMMDRVLRENPPGKGRLTERAEAAE